MATRVVSPKLLQNLRYFIRPKNSAPSSIKVSPINVTEKPDPTIIKPPTTTSTLDLGDVKELFSSVPTTKLLRSSITLQMAALEPMVDLGMWVLNSRIMETPGLREVILGTVRHTFFEHFCAGENPEDACQTVLKLWDAGLRGMLNYGLEHAADNESCDRNLEGFFQTVESTKSLPPSSVSSVVVKITAICPPDLLKRVSDLLRWEFRDNSSSLPWKLDTLPILSDCSPFYHTLEKPEPLKPQEEHDLHLAHQRLLKLCQKCLEANVPLTIDAEDTSIQPSIDYFTYSAAIVYNKDNNPVIFGTIQAYLKDSKERLLRTTKAAEKMGVPMGVKLVRGAYMSSERQLASSLGVESPIHNTIQQTHACYNDCAAFMLEKISNASGAVVLATHNVKSGKMAAAKARDLGIGLENQKLQFAQQYGMADTLSFGLRKAGFQVSKYLAFGPLQQLVPFLLRRAEENRGFLSSSTLDRQLMRKELKRRLTATIL
ncbi:hypothetical protein F0562_005227 [Nyssa sinensis]|uniref:Proline dehydrogenase n=1 Tax=Nyssa sinensis TaxID=561372 RepID=A0A5J5AJX7_9ASTE|nr:hypothetical protein F0562_005227 [Nyssa sinensis]